MLNSRLATLSTFAFGMIGSAACMQLPRTFSNLALKEKYEKEFAQQMLDPIEGFWESSNEYSETQWVAYRVEPATNNGFPFAGRFIEIRQKKAMLHPVSDPHRIFCRLKPTISEKVYAGQSLTYRGSQSFWEDVTVTLVAPTTAIMKWVKDPYMRERTLKSHLVGPAKILASRLTPAGTPQRSSIIEVPSFPEVVDRPQRTSGSGFLLTNLLVITNYHVIEDAIDIKCFIGDRVVDGIVISKDEGTDLALLRLLKSSLPSSHPRFAVGDASQVKRGQRVYAMGYPLTFVLGEGVKVHEGIISNVSGFQGSASQFQVEMNSNPGISGGPLIDQFGSVVGVVRAGLNDVAILEYTGDLPEGVTFAVKSDLIKALIVAAGEDDADITFEVKGPRRTLESMVEELGEAVVRIEVNQ